SNCRGAVFFMPEESSSPLADAAILARGILMGAADIVPGVSGGTVALLLGIYPRLLSAISNVDGKLFRLVGKGAWREAARHLDLRFLVSLAVGIVAGVLALSGVIHFLLEDHRQLTMAAFFGLILASSFLVARMSQPRGTSQTVLCLAQGLIAVPAAAWLVSGDHLDPMPGLPYVFLCGAIAICAMILPGISGAYLLVLLSKYEDIIGILHRLKAGEATSNDLATLAVFAAGCAIGLLLFSKVLKALLAKFHSETMATLAGFMAGSLWKIWPFQLSRVPGAPIDKHSITDPVWPTEWTSEVAQCVGAAIAAFVLVIVVDAVARKLKTDTQTT
ncbi:MAG: DUF368 domain-containing protein, partial [Aeoliella sp.]